MMKSCDIRLHKEPLFKEEVYGEKSIREYIRKEVLPYVRYWTMSDLEASCDIWFLTYGNVHDTGFFVVIVEHNENRMGTGWETIEHDYGQGNGLIS